MNKKVGKVIQLILVIASIACLLVMAVHLYLASYVIAMMMFILPIMFLIAYWQIGKGRIQGSMIVLVLVFSMVITLSCTLGNGIHETGIMAFPIVILFSGFVLNLRGVIYSTILVILGLGVIVFGELLGFYPYREIPAGRPVDLAVMTVMLSMAFVVSYFLSKIIKDGLTDAIQELNAQKAIQHEIEQNLELKVKLLREIHHRVKNNLAFVNSIIDLEMMGMKENETIKALQGRVHTIARVHDPLFHTMNYRDVSIKPYLEKLTSSFNIIDSEGIQLEVGSATISVEKAIPLGIILHELMRTIEAGKDQIVFRLEILKNKGTFEIIESRNKKERSPRISDGSLIEMMIRELDGNITDDKDSLKVNFAA